MELCVKSPYLLGLLTQDWVVRLNDFQNSHALPYFKSQNSSEIITCDCPFDVALRRGYNSHTHRPHIDAKLASNLSQEKTLHAACNTHHRDRGRGSAGAYPDSR